MYLTSYLRNVQIVLLFLLTYLISATTGIAGQKAEVFVQSFHSDKVNTLDFSPDGKFVVSASKDKTIKLWDMTSGREIRTFHGHNDSVNSVKFGIDGSYILSASKDKTIRLWEVATGKTAYVLNGHKDEVRSAIFSPDGRYILSMSYEQLKMWWRSGRKFESHDISGLHKKTIDAIAFSPDSKLILTGSSDRSMKLWDWQSGKLVQTFSNTDQIDSVAFSPDGRYAFSHNSRGVLQKWDIASGKEVPAFKKFNAYAQDFSPDGKLVVSYDTSNDLPKLFDQATGERLGRTFTKDTHHNGNYLQLPLLRFSRDSRSILSVKANDTRLKLWDVASGKVVRVFTGNNYKVGSIAFGADGNLALLGGWVDAKDLNLWDLNKGVLKKRVDTQDSIDSMSFSSDGKLAVTSHSFSGAELVDIASGKLLQTFKYKEYALGYSIISPNRRWVLSLNGIGRVMLWDVASGRRIWITRDELGNAALTYRILAFGPDGQYALVGGRNGEIIKLDLRTGSVIGSMSGANGQAVTDLFVSSDGRSVLAAHFNGCLTLWDIQSGRLIRNFLGDAYGPNAAALSPDGRLVVSGGFEGSLNLWDAASGTPIRSLDGHTGSVNMVAFTADSRSVLSGSTDATIRKWATDTGREIVKYATFDDGSWVTILPEGYYNASPKGASRINIRFGNSVYGIDQFYDLFYRPDIVQEKLAGKDIGNMIDLTVDKVIRNPPPVAGFTAFPRNAGSQAKVCYNLKSTGGGIGEVRVFHNGKLVKSDGFYRNTSDSPSAQASSGAGGAMRSAKTATNTSKARGDNFSDCVDLDTMPGVNEISVAGFNADNSFQGMPAVASFTASRASVSPHLYVLSIGISEFDDPKLFRTPLAKDGRDIASIIPATARGLYRPGNIHVDLLTNREATKKEIMRRIERIALSIKPWDSFIMSVSTHGAMKDNQLYLITTVANFQQAINSNELIDISKKIKALSQLYIIQSCHAGGIDSVFSGLYDARLSVLAKKLGLHIYAAAESDELSYNIITDNRAADNSYYMRAVLDGFRSGTKTDKNGDGIVSVIELGEYSKKRTNELIEERIRQVNKRTIEQTPVVINYGRDYPLFRTR